jgi:hypothetical protein
MDHVEGHRPVQGRRWIVGLVTVRIRAIAVADRVVYNSYAIDTDHPSRPTLELDARVQDSDVDGPLLVPVPEWAIWVGVDTAKAVLPELRRRGRIVDHLGVAHLAFPTWTTHTTAN